MTLDDEDDIAAISKANRPGPKRTPPDVSEALKARLISVLKEERLSDEQIEDILNRVKEIAREMREERND